MSSNTIELKEIYSRVCRALGWQPRALLVETLRSLDDAVRRGESRAILVRAPTGYGKSTISLTLYVAIKQFGRKDLGSRVIHALPMRSIGDKMFMDMREKIKILINEGFDKLSHHDLGLQHMGSPGSPYLARRFVITTGDTLVSSFFKIPPVEISKIFMYNVSHYEIPRGFIYSSVVVFDEFHLYPKAYRLGEGDKALTSMLATIAAILDGGSPVIIATATLPESILKTFHEIQGLRRRVTEIMTPAGSDNPVSRDVRVHLVSVRDRDHMVDSIVDKALYLSSKGSVVVVLNTVGSAVQVYKGIRDRLARSSASPDLILIHGRIVERYRRSAVEKLLNPSGGNQPAGRILISTQVLEAGVDVSFNYLLTEIAPPESIIQRLGRVARYGGNGEAYIYIAEDVAEKGLDPVYPQEVLEAVAKKLRTMAGGVDKTLSHKDLESLLEIYHGAPAITISRDLARALGAIDEGFDISSKDVKGLLNTICSFLRDNSLVRLLPVELGEVSDCLENRGRISNFAEVSFPVDGSILKRLYMNKMIVGIYKEDGECVSIDYKEDLSEVVQTISERECPSLEILRQSRIMGMLISGFIVRGYDKDLGLVL